MRPPLGTPANSTPHRFVVFLRGVNVGKGKRVPMTEFKSLLENLGYIDVSTLLNSGNAVFTGPARSTTRHANAIAKAMQQRLAVSTPVIVKSRAEFATIVAASPMTPPEAEHSRYLVAFAADNDAIFALKSLQALAQVPERFVVCDVAAFLYCPAGVLESPVAKALLGKAGQAVTTRNWATVLKLFARIDEAIY